MATSVVGVDIGAGAARAVEVQGYEGAKPRIIRMHQVPLPESAVRRSEVIEVGTVTTALRRLWSTGGFKTKNVVLGVGGPRVFARDVSLPRQPLPQLKESLPFQVQDMLPVPVTDVLLDFYPIQEEDSDDGPSVKGLLVAGLKEAIDANVGAAMAAGLRPSHVDLIPFALSRALSPLRTSRGCEVIVGIGANSTNVIVVDRGVPRFVRIIPNGGDDVTRAIATRLQWSPEQAEHAKRAVGMGGAVLRQEDRPVLEIIYEVVGELLTGVRNTLNFYSTANPSDPVQRAILTGGGAQLTGLPRALTDIIRLPADLAEPMKGVPTPKARDQHLGREQLDAYTTAFGLALGSHS